MADLRVDLGGLALQNPVIAASGTYGVGREYSELVEVKKLGAICTKTITLKARSGNRPPRIWETPSGMLNSIGLQNDGVDTFIERDLPFLEGLGVPVIVSIAGNTTDEYEKLAKMISVLEGVDAIELNISCPNVKVGGAIFGSNAGMAAEVTSKVRLATSKPLIVKLTPNVGDIVSVALACDRAGADAISLINTVLGMAVDIETGRPRLGAVVGGLSGPAIRPIAVRMVYQVAQSIDVPVVGMGGITGPADALEFIIAGAAAVSVGTANFVDPKAPLKVIEGIDEYLEARRIDSVNRLVGAIRVDNA